MRFRYPGPDSYGDSVFDSRMFFGRQEEVVELANLVAGLRLVVLYGKSGLGKTSLLQAGLFPRLRSLNFFPIRIRPAELAESLSEAVRDQLLRLCEIQGYDVTAPKSDSLLGFFHNTVISRGANYQVPVLVLDQFEEIFNRLEAERRTELITELQGLLYPPVSRLEPPDVRVVLSFREEYLGSLDEFSNVLPGVLAHRYRLGPLGRRNAEEAIVQPAAVEDSDSSTPTFRVAPGEVGEMLDYLEDKAHNVEPIELQILCQHIEREVLRRHKQGRKIKPVTLQDYFPEGMQAALEHFYLDTIKDYTGATRRRIRRFCEQGLVTLDGYRDSIRQRRIRSQYGLEDAILDELVNKRLLRREDRLNDVWYELTHDRLAEAVVASRREVVVDRMLLRSRVWVELLLVITVCAVANFGFSYSLTRQAEPVIPKIHALRGDLEILIPTRILAPPPARFISDPGPSRFNLKEFLAPEIEQGLLTVDSLDNRDVISIPSDILFSSGTADIIYGGNELVSRIAEGLEQQSDPIMIRCHSDNVPFQTLAYPSSRALTEARATAVSNRMAPLLSSPTRIRAAGYGDREPLASNETAEGRALNRRIEIILGNSR